MKKTLYLLPGLSCDRALWRHQIEYLSSEYDVRVPDFKSGETIESFSELVLADAPEKFSVAGLSMGAYVALEVALNAPQRVERLALLDASPFADLPEHAEYRTAAIKAAKDHGLSAVMEKTIPMLIHPKRYEDEELVQAIDAMAWRVGEEGYLKQQSALLNRRDYVDALSLIQCSTVVVVGRQDALTPPKVSKVIADKIENSSLVEIENCGHLSTMEQPEAVTAVLRYWMQN